MADIVLARQTVGRSGVDVTYTTLTDSDDYYAANGSGVGLHIKNGGGSAATVTFDTTQTVDGLDLENPTLTVPANSDRFVGGFPASWEDVSTHPGSIKFSQDQAADVTAAVIRL